MKKRSRFTRTDFGSPAVLKRTESDSCWKRNHTPPEVHRIKSDEGPYDDNRLNVYQQLTRSYSWLKQNVFHTPDAESIVISNKKIKHVLREFSNKDFVVQNLKMPDEDSAPPGNPDEVTDDRRKTFRQSHETDHPIFQKSPRHSGNTDEGPKIEAPVNEGGPEEGGEVKEPENKPPENEEPQAVPEPAPEGVPEPAPEGVPEPAPEAVPEPTPEAGPAEATPEQKEEKGPPEEPKEAEDLSKSEADKKTKLSEADQRAKNMAKFIEEMRAALAEYANKEEMTEEDAKEMLKKQEELMAKLSEFEEITKHVQDLAGIENISSSLLGAPVQCREVNPCGPSPLDNFPKVICFDRISQHELGVPNMIVCEPVCKDNKPCGGGNQPPGKRFPLPGQERDAERYIQKEISRELPSTEVLGMLDREGIVGQPLQPTALGPAIPAPMQAQPLMAGPQMGGRMMGPQPGMAGPQVQQRMMLPQGQPGMMGAQPWPAMAGLQVQSAMMGPQPGMMGPQPGMMGPQRGMMGPQPGMMGLQPGMMGPQSAMMGLQPGMMGPQLGMMGPQQGMMVPQTGMLGAQGQIKMMGPQPQAAMMTPQGRLKSLGSEAQPVENGTLAEQKWEEEEKPEITIKEQELVSVQTTKRIIGDSKLITEHSETDRTKETSIEITTDPERSSKQKSLPGKNNIVDGLKTQIENLQTEMKCVMAENKDLQKRIMMTSPEATKQMLRHRTEIPAICRKTLSTKPICKLDLYRQLNLPLPSPLGSPQSKNKEGSFPPHLQLPSQSPLGGISPGKCRRDLNSKVLCRRNIIKQLGFSGEGATKDMETMVTSMEEEVKAIQAELNAVQEERRTLEMQKKLLSCTGPAIASQSGKGTAATQSTFIVGGYPEVRSTQTLSKNLVGDVPYNQSSPLRDLREQYSKLQQDYQLKVEEISMLRVELESARRESIGSIEKSEEAEARVDDLIARLKAVEDEKSKITSNKDQMIELEQQLVLAKQRYKEINEELDELRSQIADQAMQTDEYRKKFLNAQQNVEEQRRQIEMMEMESGRFGEQVTIELQRVKAQFQTKLEELAPLPELLRKTQDKLKEMLHVKTLAEKNCLIMSQNLELVNEEREKLREQLDEINKNKNESEAEKASLKINLTDGEKKMEETKAENDKLRDTVSRLEELAVASERKYEEKVQEGLQLQSQLETLREESARQVSRTKDRYENMRRSLQGQIFDLENQLAATRASAKAAQKDRDEIRQKMQAQIIQLNENFDQAQMRIRSLQSHVNYLKTSYSSIFPSNDKSNTSIILP